MWRMRRQVTKPSWTQSRSKSLWPSHTYPASTFQKIPADIGEIAVFFLFKINSSSCVLKRITLPLISTSTLLQQLFQLFAADLKKKKNHLFVSQYVWTCSHATKKKFFSNFHFLFHPLSNFYYTFSVSFTASPLGRG